MVDLRESNATEIENKRGVQHVMEVAGREDWETAMTEVKAKLAQHQYDAAQSATATATTASIPPAIPDIEGQIADRRTEVGEDQQPGVQPGGIVFANEDDINEQLRTWGSEEQLDAGKIAAASLEDPNNLAPPAVLGYPPPMDQLADKMADKMGPENAPPELMGHSQEIPASDSGGQLSVAFAAALAAVATPATAKPIDLGDTSPGGDHAEERPRLPRGSLNHHKGPLPPPQDNGGDVGDVGEIIWSDERRSDPPQPFQDEHRQGPPPQPLQDEHQQVPPHSGQNHDLPAKRRRIEQMQQHIAQEEQELQLQEESQHRTEAVQHAQAAREQATRVAQQAAYQEVQAMQVEQQAQAQLAAMQHRHRALRSRIYA